jgi:hypothetical protein
VATETKIKTLLNAIQVVVEDTEGLTWLQQSEQIKRIAKEDDQDGALEEFISWFEEVTI